MNIKDYSAQIAKNANVNEQQARRVMQAVFTDVKRKLNTGEHVVLPTLGRLINQTLPNGDTRVILTRPGQNKKPQPAKAAKAPAKQVRGPKKAAAKKRPAPKAKR